MTESLQHAKIRSGKQCKTSAEGLGRTKLNLKASRRGSRLAGWVPLSLAGYGKKSGILLQEQRTSLDGFPARNWRSDLHFKKITLAGHVGKQIKGGQEWKELWWCEPRTKQVVLGVNVFRSHWCFKKEDIVYISEWFSFFLCKNVFMCLYNKRNKLSNVLLMYWLSLETETFREYLLTLKTYFITKQPVKSRKKSKITLSQMFLLDYSKV